MDDKNLDLETQKAVDAFKDVIRFFEKYKKELQAESFTDGFSKQYEFENMTYVKTYSNKGFFCGGTLYVDDNQFELYKNGDTSLDSGFTEDTDKFLDLYEEIKPNMDYFEEKQVSKKKKTIKR